MAKVGVRGAGGEHEIVVAVAGGGGDKVRLANGGQTVTVGYNTSNGTATAGADYTAATNTLTFAPGVTTQIITVAIANDTTFEGAETFNVNLVTPTNATIADNLGLGTIRDDGTGSGGTDNDTPALSVSTITVAEGAGFGVFTVSLSNPAATGVTVDYATSSGTATVPGDVTAGTSALAGTLTFAPGVLTQTVTLNITNDTVYEVSEAFTVNLSNASAGSAIADAIGVGTITDDGTGTVGGINRVAVETADGDIAFEGQIKLSLSVDHRAIDGAAGAAFLQTLKALIETPESLFA